MGVHKVFLNFGDDGLSLIALLVKVYVDMNPRPYTVGRISEGFGKEPCCSDSI